MEWLFSCEYWLLLVSKCCFGISIFLIIDIIFQSGLLGFNLKEKWIRFLNNNFSTHITVGFFIYLSFNYPFELFSTAYAMSEDETAKATIEVSNVKISNLDQAIKYGAGAGVFSTLFASTTKLVKTSSLPLGGKIAAGLGTSVVGLMTYKVLQENTYTTKPKGQIIIEADNVNSSTSISPVGAEKLIDKIKDKSFPAKSMLDPTDSLSDKDFYIISQHGVEALNWTYYLNLAILYMIYVLIIFLIMKILSEYDVKLDFVKKLPLGNLIYLLLKKLKDIWRKTTIVWIFFIVFVILIGVCISAWSIYMVINNLG